MMLEHELTRHAKMRMRQRGLRDNDMRLLLAVASQVAPDAYFLTEKDAAREIAARKQEIQCLERLRGSKVIVEEGSVVTYYRPGRENMKRTLRRRNANK
jgi:hypothetical protein